MANQPGFPDEAGLPPVVRGTYQISLLTHGLSFQNLPPPSSPQRKSSLFCHSTLNSDETNVRSGYHPDLCSISFNSKEGALVILGIFSQATSILPFYRPVKLKNLVLLWEFCSFTFMLRMRWIPLPTRYTFSYQSSLYSQKHRLWFSYKNKLPFFITPSVNTFSRESSWHKYEQWKVMNNTLNKSTLEWKQCSPPWCVGVCVYVSGHGVQTDVKEEFSL